MAIFFGIIILAGFFWGFMGLVFPDFKFYFKYKIKRKEPNEEDVEFLVDLIERGFGRENVIKEALLTGKYTPKKAKELRYLFLEVEKSLKGGIKE